MESEAREAGVNTGHGNEFHSRFWCSSEPYLITIGNGCQIAKDVKIFTHGGAKAARHISPRFDCFGKVAIGDNVYIGSNALIMPGVTIGNNVLVAAGSVVCNSVPDGTVIGGNHARIICTVEEYYRRNLPFNTDTKGLGTEEKKAVLLSLPEEKFIKKKSLQIQ